MGDLYEESSRTCPQILLSHYCRPWKTSYITCPHPWAETGALTRSRNCIRETIVDTSISGPVEGRNEGPTLKTGGFSKFTY